MQKSKNLVKPVAGLALIFLSLGVAFANVVLSHLGLQQNYVLMVSIAFVVSVLMISRNVLFIALICTGVAAINLSDPALARYGLDRDVLIGFVCALILVPTVCRLGGR